MDIQLINEAVFNLTNQERIKHRLPAFLPDLSLAKAATLHSDNMVKDNFYSHTDWKNRGLRTPQDRIIQSGGKFSFLGENIAKGPCFDFVGGVTFPQLFGIQFGLGSATKALTPMEFAIKMVEGWMKSSGHRANILHKEFRFLGVGTSLNNHSYGLCTQNFGG
ncbi:MAG: CAP domain-containing protein [Spirosomataceae bacterium]